MQILNIPVKELIGANPSRPSLLSTPEDTTIHNIEKQQKLSHAAT